MSKGLQRPANNDKASRSIAGVLWTAKHLAGTLQASPQTPYFGEVFQAVYERFRDRDVSRSTRYRILTCPKAQAAFLHELM
nr:hypothetical protein [Pseudomonas caspiana]